MQNSGEIIIVGGGIIGLAIAIELRLLGATVTVLCADFAAAASHAAGGMLAPQAEEIPPGPMLDLCLGSRDLYPDWIHKIEAITGISTGYWPCGILAPRYTVQGSGDHWLSQESISHQQTGLSQQVIGGYWYPQDGQVDNRSLTQALRVASHCLGVEFIEGVRVTQFDRDQGRITKLITTQGEMSAQHYILATGAWSQTLLPIPVLPRKGQMLSVVVPTNQRHNLPLQQVLFGEETYIIPRQDGRIVVGATSEDVGFAPQNTVAGIHALLANAIGLFPALRDYAIQEYWWGFRPATPDELPILGNSADRCLTLATGHYRNGILLAPITAKVIAELVWHQRPNAILAPFSWQRFSAPQPMPRHDPHEGKGNGDHDDQRREKGLEPTNDQCVNKD